LPITLHPCNYPSPIHPGTQTTAPSRHPSRIPPRLLPQTPQARESPKASRNPHLQRRRNQPGPQLPKTFLLTTLASKNKTSRTSDPASHGSKRQSRPSKPFKKQSRKMKTSRLSRLMKTPVSKSRPLRPEAEVAADEL